MRWVISIVIAIAILLPSVSVGEVKTKSNLWNWSADAKHHQAVVQVEVDNARGTGILIRVDEDKPVGRGFEGYCLTAYHVIEKDKERRVIRVTYSDGSVAKRCRVVRSDRESDVAIVHVWVPPNTRPVEMAKVAVRPGDQIEFAGLGGTIELECCLRHFSAKAAAPTSSDEIFADATLLPGDSGGPVFNSQQHVVGVISGGWIWWDGGQKTEAGQVIRTTWPARAANADAIRKLLEGDLSIARK